MTLREEYIEKRRNQDLKKEDIKIYEARIFRNKNIKR